MTIVTAQFNGHGCKGYDELVRVFRDSVAEHMPEARYEELLMEAPDKVAGLGYAQTANTAKLKEWVKFLEQCDDDVILADCDMLMLQSAAHAFDKDFDVAFTVRTHGHASIPVNNGIMMVRNTQAGKDFFRILLEVNDRMYYEDAAFKHEWQAKYPGMNQAAFGYVYETGCHEAKMHAYQTVEWNAVDGDWPYITDKTVFLHLKGALRRQVLAMKPAGGPMAAAMRLWYEASGRPELCESGLPYAGNKCRRMLLLQKKLIYKRDRSNHVSTSTVA